MGFKKGYTFPAITPQVPATPAGYNEVVGIKMCWTCHVEIDLNNKFYEGLVLVKGDKEARFSFDELSQKLGLEW